MTRPFATLTSHFVGVILSPPILTELGGDYLRRTLSSVVGMLLLAGVFLPSAFFKKYVDLNAEIRPDHFEPALRADTVLMIAVPMLIAALIAVVISPMMFPDETDYQVLTPLPVTRGAHLRRPAVRTRGHRRGWRGGDQRDHEHLVSVRLWWAARPLSARVTRRGARRGSDERHGVGRLGCHGPSGADPAALSGRLAASGQPSHSRRRAARTAPVVAVRREPADG